MAAAAWHAQLSSPVYVIHRIIESLRLEIQSSSHSAPSLKHCLGLLWPKCRTWHLVLLNLIPLASAQLFRSLCRALLPSGRSTLPASLVSSANLLSVHSVPSSRSSFLTIHCFLVLMTSLGRNLTQNFFFQVFSEKNRRAESTEPNVLRLSMCRVEKGAGQFLSKSIF